MRKPTWDTVAKVITAIVVVITLLCVLYIMANRLGLVSGYDFGAGAYYYADIPQYEQIVRDDVYRTDIPLWIHIILFLAWGWLMYRLWVWLDKRT